MSPPNLSPQRGSVIQISPEQWDALEAQFAKVKNPHPTDLVLLAAEIGLDETDVQVKFIPFFHQIILSIIFSPNGQNIYHNL
jgi:Homeodomain